MHNFTFEYLYYLTQRYPTYANTRTLWEAAGGHIGEIEDQGAAIDRWTHLLRIAEQGALRPLDLTLAALKRDPHNGVLLSDLELRLPAELRERAKITVEQVLKDPKSKSAELALTQLGDLNEPEVVAATVLATEQAEKKQSGAREILLEVAKVAATELTKGGVLLLGTYLGVPGLGQ